MPQKYESIINYGLQNKKSKQDIIAALVKENELNSAGTYLKQLDELKAFGDEKGVEKQPDLSGASAGERQSVADIDSTIQMSREAKSMIGGISTGPVAGRVQGAKQMLPGGGDESFNKLEAKLSNIKSNFMKALSGAAVSEQEVERLSKFLPSVNDQEEVIKIKLEALENELSNRKKNTFKSLGIETPEGSEVAPKEQVADQINKAIEFSKANPEDPMAKRFMDDWNNNRIDLVTGKLKDEFKELTPYEQKLKEQGLSNPQKKSAEPQTPEDKAEAILNSQMQADGFKKDADYANSFKGFMANFIDALGENTGMKKFGQGIGATIFLNSKQGKELQEKASSGDQNALEALQNILKEAPESKEVVGSAAMTALNALSGGLASKGATAVPKVLSFGEKILQTGKKIFKGAGIGATYDTASDLEQNKSTKEALTPGVGTAIGATAEPVMMLNKALKARKALNLTEEANRAMGQIVQGTKEDVAPAIETLGRIDREGVKTYEDFSGRINENNKILGQTMDEILAQDPSKRKLSEFVTVSDVGGKKVKTNYIDQALSNLDELYTKTNAPEEAQRIKNLIERAKSNNLTDGLTVSEINDIAKEYGKNGKSFNKKTGEQLTSISSEAYENTRKGIKKTIRNILPKEISEKAIALDKKFTENLNTKRLVDNMAKKVNELEQKVTKRNLLQKVGRLTGAVVDTATGGILKSFFSKVLLESNAGLKSMNSLGIQSNLEKNIKKVEAVLNSEPNMLERNLTNLINEMTKEYSAKDVLNKAKSIRLGMNLESIAKESPKVQELLRRYKEIEKSWTYASKSGRKQYEKALQDIVKEIQKLK